MTLVIYGWTLYNNLKNTCCIFTQRALKRITLEKFYSAWGGISRILRVIYFVLLKRAEKMVNWKMFRFTTTYKCWQFSSRLYIRYLCSFLTLSHYMLWAGGRRNKDLLCNILLGSTPRWDYRVKRNLVCESDARFLNKCTNRSEWLMDSVSTSSVLN